MNFEPCLQVDRQKAVPLVYETLMDCGFRALTA